MINHTKPLVSVCVHVFNQKDYISKCISSIVNQNTRYSFEVIIGDDASRDGTREIIEDYKLKYPGLIKTVLHDKNIGACENYKSIYRLTSGDYAIHIDGDDYMLPNRIEEQINFLINNLDCAAVMHKLKLIDKYGIELGKEWPVKFTKKKYSTDDILLNHPVFGHSSLAFKRDALDDLLAKNYDNFIDFELYLELSKHGLIGVIDHPLGAYRVSVGISTGRNLYQLAIEAIERSATGFASKKVIDKALARQYFLFAKKAFVDKDFELAKYLIKESVGCRLFSIKQGIFYLLRDFGAIFYRMYLLKKYFS